LGVIQSRGAHLKYGQTLGKGAFGTVMEAHNRLDGRVVAVKKINFRSPHPPWTSLEVLEEHHQKLLREVLNVL
jgi:serine/threonine protein kinase